MTKTDIYCKKNGTFAIELMAKKTMNIIYSSNNHIPINI